MKNNITINKTNIVKISPDNLFLIFIKYFKKNSIFLPMKTTGCIFVGSSPKKISNNIEKINIPNEKGIKNCKLVIS
ncbi:hypothetical protein MARBORIA2_09010 [Methanobrevibacter arboriphilus]|jgi:hypothetical protein|uniref:Uncharacterized protein n=1 Tax=Methanobrevibacter arboriphilus TaxID=39441 RepID=A0ACA8R3K8_METAZ|nr:hypothetical protein MarbSA_11960 [Methanobrevibacter arboriphilus]GLI11811.1 hypothetical protein MARBORIA2_09010 [Methanobrevibacter arboriphilus]